MTHNVKQTSPQYTVYQVDEKNDLGDATVKKGFWNPVGAAWMHNDNKGMNIQLKSFPLDGKLVLREIEKKEPVSDVSSVGPIIRDRY